MSAASKSPPPLEILLVEDNPGDIELTEEAFREGKIVYNMHVARDGEEALDFLYQRGKFTEARRPDIILLDLNMPRKNGKEVLAIIKEDSKLHGIPIVVLSSSAAEQDIVKSYSLYANAYIVKPVDLDQFLRVVRELEDFWLSVVRLPPRRD